jgi:hypothetical protein
MPVTKTASSLQSINIVVDSIPRFLIDHAGYRLTLIMESFKRFDRQAAGSGEEGCRRELIESPQGGR